MEEDPAIDSFTPIPVRLKAQVIYDEIAINSPGNPEQRGDHFDGRADRINNICPFVQAYLG
jgi:hypothetical protein